MSVEERPSVSSFRSMYRQHYGLVWSAARRFGVEDHQLDDAVQEVFLVAYRRMASFGGGSVKAWLYAIARRVASNYRRTQRRTRLRQSAVRRTVAATRPRAFQTAEAWQTVERFVAGLPERHRELFVLSQVEGMTGAEAARTLGLRPSTAYDAIRALRRRFRSEVVDDAEPRVRLQRLARRARPKATTRSWSALVVAMPSRWPASPPLGSGGSMGSTASLGLAGSLVGLAAVVTLAVGLGTSNASSARRPITPQTDTTHAPSERRSPPSPTPLGPLASTAPPPTTPSRSTPSRPPRAARSTPTRPPRTMPPAASVPAVRSLAAENALLRDAAAALDARDPARALELADRHVREYVDSPMTDVGLALRIESLCQLNKQAQARGEARLFLRRRPESPLADRIERACPADPSTPPITP